MNGTVLAGFGAFLSGVGSVIGAIWAIRALRRRLERECAERLELLREGIRLGRDLDP